eukprot:TRINITY_DN22229_c0_g1_i1.p1 TRINITY_DN22229_c0_g1~~TRINITY_DN22229_c0_g1_i1.p1  ORF type:complete len:315 (+),score=53.32 TRINITY_DN22229_c0_g1_i1:42-947(+)
MTTKPEIPPYFSPASDTATKELETMAAFDLPPPHYAAPTESQMEHALDTKALLQRFRILQQQQAAEAETYLRHLLNADRPEKSPTTMFSDDTFPVHREEDSPRTIASPLREPRKRMFYVGVRPQPRSTVTSTVASHTGLECVKAVLNAPAKKCFPVCMRDVARCVVSSHVFLLASSLVVVANAICVTYYLDRGVRHSTGGATRELPWNQEEGKLDLMFAVIFTIELFLRFLKDELELFITTHPDFVWNLLDLLVVSCEWFDRCLTASVEAGSDIDVSVLRTLRIFRIVRLVRFIRLLLIVS